MGLTTSKSFVSLLGSPLLAWSSAAFDRSDIECIVIATNSAAYDSVAALLRDFIRPSRFDLVRADTSSALDTFNHLMNYDLDADWIIVSVDTVLAPNSIPGLMTAYTRVNRSAPILGVAAASHLDGDGLHVELDDTLRVRAVGPAASGPFVSAGAYAGSARNWPKPDVDSSRWGMRDYLFWLSREHCLHSVVLDFALDLDTPDDVDWAEQRLRSLDMLGPM